MTKEEALYLSIGEQIDGAVSSQMFGKPCLKIGKKAFVCFFQNKMVFKLAGEALGDALSLEWVQVPFDYSESWTTFAKSAMEYVDEK